MQICQSLGSFYLLETNSMPIAYSDFFWGIWTILHGENPWYEAICEAILVVIVAGGTSQNFRVIYLGRGVKKSEKFENHD